MIQKEDLSNIPTMSFDSCIYYGDVTPEIAARWLSFNTENRNIRPVVLNRYVEAMNKGLWEENYSVIRFRNNGTLLDGQHRLQAIVKSGKTLPFIVITGQEKTHHMDDGATRSIKDLITMFNYNIPGFYKDTHVIATANLALRLTGKSVHASGAVAKSDPKEIEDWIGRHEDAIKFVFGSSKLKGGAKGHGVYNVQSSAVGLALVAAYDAGVDKSTLDDWINGATRHEYSECNCGKNAMIFEMYYSNSMLHRGKGAKDLESLFKICSHNILLTETKQNVKSIRPYDKIDFPIPR